MKWIKKLALASAAGLICLFVLEMLLRLVTPEHRPLRWPVVDKRYGFVNRPNFEQTIRYSRTNVVWTVRINSIGLRGPEYDLSRRDDVRILLLGDSFTFGYGVNEEDSFAGRLRTRLAEAGCTATVINVSAAGWGTRQQILFAEDRLAQIRPSLVIATYCGNDQVDDELFAAGRAGGVLPAFPGKRFLRDHSVLYSRVYDALYGRLYGRIQHTIENKLPPAGESPVAAAPVPGNNALLDRRWVSTEEQLRQFMARVRAITPEAELFVQAAEFWNPVIVERLSAVADGELIHYVPLQAAFAGEPRESLLLGFDPHWNAATHDRVARVLCQAIAGRGLIGLKLPAEETASDVSR